MIATLVEVVLYSTSSIESYLLLMSRSFIIEVTFQVSLMLRAVLDDAFILKQKLVKLLKEAFNYS